MVIKKVAVIGQGYVGLPLSLEIANAGFQVIGFDTDNNKILNLKSGHSHVEDISDLHLKRLLDAEKYYPTDDCQSLADVDIAIIAVPTPLTPQREPDLSYLISASEILRDSLTVPALIINESTSFPGTLRNVIAPILAKNELGLSHSFAISPERVDPGNKIWGIKNTPRLVAGLDEESSKIAGQFYSNFCDEVIMVSSPEVAETAKLFENTFRQVNIALVNELSITTDALGVSVVEVLNAASTKPYGFMKFNTGLGVGGHCIPVDPTYLSYVARQNGVDTKFINLANEVNLQMPFEVVKRIKKNFNASIKGKSVLVCGVAYKPNVSDTRETPSELLIRALRDEGANVEWHDPVVKQWKGQSSRDLTDANFDIGVIAVKHAIFDVEQIKAKCNFLFDCTGLN